MKYNCQFADGKIIQVDCFQFKYNNDELSMKSFKPLPFELSNGQFMRVWHKEQLLFEGYASLFDDNSFELRSYFYDGF